MSGPPELEPVVGLELSLGQAIARRRSVRELSSTPLPPAVLARLAWAAQGLTDDREGGRAVPSAGATHPLEVVVATAAGVQRYHPVTGRLMPVESEDRRAELCAAALGQPVVGQAAATFAIVGVQARITRRYGQRGIRYLLIEVGHACQNLQLAAVALGLGSVSIGAYHDGRVGQLLGLQNGEWPLCLVCVGTPRGDEAGL